jgi:hypothetical protein
VDVTAPFSFDDAIQRPLHEWLVRKLEWISSPYVRWAIESDKPDTYIRIEFLISKKENGDITFKIISEGSRNTPIGD